MLDLYKEKIKNDICDLIILCIIHEMVDDYQVYIYKVYNICNGKNVFAYIIYNVCNISYYLILIGAFQDEILIIIIHLINKGEQQEFLIFILMSSNLQ